MRYFTVFLSENGSVLSVNTGRIAAVDTNTAIEYALDVFHTGRGQGFVGDYRYTTYSAGSEIHMIFLDYSREMSAFRTFLLSSTAVSVFGLLAVLLLLLFLSGRIVKPFLENDEKQKQFITDAGHELKTPLTIIDADAEVLAMDLGENEWLNDIQTQTKRLAQLTNSLVLLSRMEELPQTEKIDFPLSDLVEETVETFQALARTQHKNLSAQIQPMLSMRGDERAIRQLLTIFLDNAVKYTDDGGRIEIVLQKQKNNLCLSVYNTTEHISKDALAHLFDRFYRTDRTQFLHGRLWAGALHRLGHCQCSQRETHCDHAGRKIPADYGHFSRLTCRGSINPPPARHKIARRIYPAGNFMSWRHAPIWRGGSDPRAPDRACRSRGVCRQPSPCGQPAGCRAQLFRGHSREGD